MRRDYNTEASKIRSDECNADEGGTGGGERERWKISESSRQNRLSVEVLQFRNEAVMITVCNRPQAADEPRLARRRINRPLTNHTHRTMAIAV